MSQSQRPFVWVLFASFWILGCDAPEQVGLSEAELLAILEEKKQFVPSDGAFNLKVEKVDKDNLINIVLIVKKKGAIDRNLTKITGKTGFISVDNMTRIATIHVEDGQMYTEDGLHATFRRQAFRFAGPLRDAEKKE